MLSESSQLQCLSGNAEGFCDNACLHCHTDDAFMQVHTLLPARAIPAKAADALSRAGAISWVGVA